MGGRLTPINAAINDLKSRIGSKEVELRKLRERLRVLEAERASITHGVREGSLVTYLGEEYRVASVDGTRAGKPWVRGYRRKKDGTFRTVIRQIYDDWELVE